MASNQKHQHSRHAPDERHASIAASLTDQRAEQNNHREHQQRPANETRTLRALQALTDTALSHLSLEALLPELLERVRTVMQVDNVAILLLDAETRELAVSAASGPEEEVVGRLRIPVGEGFAGRIAATQEPLAVEDLSTFPITNPLLRDRLRSAMGVPLLAGGRLLGVVHIGTTTPHTFSSDEEALLQQAADRIARAVERAQLFSAERDMRLALQRQATLINLSFEPIFVWSMERGIVEWNAGAEHLYGYTRAEALGRVSHDLLRTVHPVPLKAQLAVLERDGHWTGEVRHTTKDGREVVVESRQQIIDLGGQLLILETNRDVTERLRLERQALEAMRQAEERARRLEVANARLRTLVEVLPVGVAIVDAAGKPVLVNDVVRQVWGQDLPMAESVAHYGEYRAWRTDTGRPVAADEWGLAQALSRGAVSVGVEYDIEAFDGQRKTILDSAVPLRDESGAVTGAVSVIFDVTEQKQRTERTHAALEAFIAITRALVEAPSETDAASDAEGETPARLRDESPLARRLTELTRGILGCSRVAVTSVEEVDGRLYDWPVAIVGMTPEQERTWWSEQAAARPRELGASLRPEDRARLLAGEVLTLDLTRPPYQVANNYGITALLWTAMRTQGRIVGMLALDFEDPSGHAHVFTPEEIQIAEAVARLGAVVLERDRLLREREAARAEALALTGANRRMDEFLGIAGHELRTPLTTVKANLQLAERRARQLLELELEAYDASGGGRARLRQGSGPAEQLLRLLDRSTHSVERQERLVQDLLDVSRIAAGQLEYRMERYDLAALVREAVEEQRASTPERRITLEAPAEPVVVEADADRIGQVLTNYLTNALKYSAADQPVSVALYRLESTVRVEVRDGGPGLSPAQQRHLFERFSRVEGIEVMSGSGVGLGLGLYISRTIVARHGGTVGVESAPGKGSTFWFTLPLSQGN